MSTGKLISNLTKCKRNLIERHYSSKATFILWNPAIDTNTDVLLTSYTDVLHDRDKEHLPWRLMSF